MIWYLFSAQHFKAFGQSSVHIILKLIRGERAYEFYIHIFTDALHSHRQGRTKGDLWVRGKSLREGGGHLRPFQGPHEGIYYLNLLQHPPISSLRIPYAKSNRDSDFTTSNF